MSKCHFGLKYSRFWLILSIIFVLENSWKRRNFCHTRLYSNARYLDLRTEFWHSVNKSRLCIEILYHISSNCIFDSRPPIALNHLQKRVFVSFFISRNPSNQSIAIKGRIPYKRHLFGPLIYYFTFFARHLQLLCTDFHIFPVQFPILGFSPHLFMVFSTFPSSFKIALRYFFKI